MIGINKRKLHHAWRSLRAYNPWYFFAAAVVFFVIGILGYRQNNLNAITLRDEVLAVDKGNGDVEAALRKLREYTYAHMNTDLSSGAGIQQPIQLKYRYERLVAAEKERVQASSGQVYADAQKFCEAKFPGSFSGGPRVPCIQEYVVSHGGQQATPVPDSLYKFSFASPRWSFDFAGWCLFITVLLAGIGIMRSLLGAWMKYELE